MATRRKSNRRATRTPTPATEEIIETGSDEMDEQDSSSGFLDAATPILGLVAGGFVAAKGAEKIGVPEKWAPWGVAAVGVYGAIAAQGRMRQAAIGVAAGGISIGIMKAMGMLDLLAAMPSLRQAAAMQPATPSVPNAITRDDLQQALGDAARKNEAQLKELEQQHLAQLSELQRAYESRVEEICGVYSQRLAEKDQTISELLRELRKVQTAGPGIVHRDATVPVEEPAPVEAATDTNAEEIAAPAEPDAISKAQAIRGQLTADENLQLQQLLATASPEMVALAEAQIANMSADDAVGYLRENVLTSPKAA
ncbi:MAG: hypothetical protein ACXV5L_00600 [Thermoanaerobaculia bacterium]